MIIQRKMNEKLLQKQRLPIQQQQATPADAKLAKKPLKPGEKKPGPVSQLEWIGQQL
jgi:hypothetical protein